jgi:hypothetical protein
MVLSCEIRLIFAGSLRFLGFPAVPITRKRVEL